jgi:hypothetical protein
VAAALTAATNVAQQVWLHADPPVPMEQVLTEALAQLAAGLPTP